MFFMENPKLLSLQLGAWKEFFGGKHSETLPRITICQHNVHAPQQLTSPLPSLMHLQAERRQDGPLGTCLHLPLSGAKLAPVTDSTYHSFLL